MNLLEKILKVIEHIKALVNKKGIPFIYVSPQSIEVYDNEPRNTQFKGLSSQIGESNKTYIPWRKYVDDNELIELDPSKVILEDEDHINHSSIG